VKTLALRAKQWRRCEHSRHDGTARVGGRSIYVLPTRYGVMFAVLLGLMLIGALNYDNNPAYLLTFLLGSIGFNGIYLTWRNLRGVRLKLLASDPVFCGDDARLRFQLLAEDGSERPGIQLHRGDQSAAEDLGEKNEAGIISLEVPTQTRGRLQAGRLSVSTRYPLGLFRAWCYIELAGDVLVYPAPASPRQMPSGGADRGEGAGNDIVGQEDFVGLREYRQGDTSRHIDWKSLARERGLVSKMFTTPQGKPRQVDWYALPGTDTELKLSQMTRAVLDAELAGEAFSLRLPDQVIDSGQGPAHRHACLSALACFDIGGTAT
jgi:uncharacterized protein (DUF58 family)